MRQQNYGAAQMKKQNKSSICPLFCDAAMNRNKKKWSELEKKPNF